MNFNMLQILIGGEAGQGLVTVGDLLARILVKSGYHIHVTQTYMSRIRGGHNTFAICVGCERQTAPREPVNILVALDADTVRLHRDALVPDNNLIILDEAVSVEDQNCVYVPFENLAGSRYLNVVALGVVAALLGLDKTLVGDTVAASFENKDDEVSRANRAAVDAAYAWVETVPSTTNVALEPVRPDDAPRTVLKGNEAIALGALAGGVKFCAFYPMSPATSIMLNLVRHADTMGIVVEQAEDEIAAINMAVGAAFSGCPSMTATSGGGFALMTEGVSLAGMTETPVVIVIAQRPGPATGLPTRTEQGDLEFALHGGHGEFPRAIFAPGTIEACFEHMSRIFALAEASQGPVILLTEQFLADSYQDVEPFKIPDTRLLEPVAPTESSESYSRYAITESGVSFRRIPGAGTELVAADSDEHDESGHITEDLGVRRKMTDKRLRKMRILLDNIVAPEYSGDAQADLLLMSWGSPQEAVNEAAVCLREKGKRVGTLHFSQVWPLDPKLFMDYLCDAKRVVCVEGNATGQFARLIRRETGFEVHGHILRYDGLPLTPEYITGGLEHE
ncbi:MAG: 2-oxoacid:acceptor oxidoreductase subunit alpha [Kiritimatiellia bacterium]